MSKRKRAAKSKHWCLTLNNPTEADLVIRPGEPGSPFTYLILAREKGEDGTPHLQGYCVFINRVRLTQAKKIWPRAHLEMKRGTPLEAMEYCKKDGDWDEWGKIPKGPGEREKADWQTYYEMAKDGDLEDIPAVYRIRYYHAFKRIRQDNPPEPEDLKTKLNYWVLAPSQHGKSTYARKRWGPKSNLFDKAPNKWFTGYKGEDNILLDDFGPKQCRYLGWYMKRWADLFSFPMETKGGGTQIRPKHIIVTSQYTIEQCFEDEFERIAIENRFTVIKLPHWKKRIKF